ncbi:transcription factor GAMYB-like [Curcuma longa]|uniref:transcription factor GAMYB-like n=1 Tax=Curcuma longa TaxID=136217 RepID=UPI003D9F65C5
MEKLSSNKKRWTEAEDACLIDYVKKNGERNWNAIAKSTGLNRCGKSCRSRWLDHLKPDLKKSPITPEEEHLIRQLQAKMGNKWSKIVKHLPGRTDNEIKNFWNCKMKEKSQRDHVPLEPAPLAMGSSEHGGAANLRRGLGGLT